MTGDMSILDVQIDREGDTAQAVVSGDLDLATSARFEAELFPLVADGVRQLTLDLGGIRFADSTGLRVMFALKKMLDAREGFLVLDPISPSFAALLRVSGLVDAFGVMLPAPEPMKRRRSPRRWPWTRRG